MIKEWLITDCNNVVPDDGLRFLYKKQHEQQKHETKVIIRRAAAAPTMIPMYIVKLKYNRKDKFREMTER